MGILDNLSNLSPEQTQGLLAAAAQILQQSGPSRTPTSFGQIAGGGLQAYQGGNDAAQLRKMQQEQAAQSSQLHGLQIQGLQGELGDKALARQQNLQAQDVYQKYNSGLSAPAPVAPQSVLGSDMAPTVENAAKLSAAQPPTGAQPPDEYTRRMGYAQALRSAGLNAQADAAEQQALKFKPEFDQTPRVAVGPDGKPFSYVLDKNGTIKRLDGVLPRDELHFQDTGGGYAGLDKFTGAPLITGKKTMTPGEIANANQAAARLNFDKSQADNNQDAVMDPLAVRLTAQQYLAGDSSALQNFGRGAQGAKNLNAVRLEVSKIANEAGLNGSDIAAKMAEFAGLKAGQRTAATRSANIEIAANEAAALAPIALAASEKVSRSGFLPFGKAQIMFDSNTNNPDLRQFAMANTALVNAYGQAMARGGSATVSDKDHAREMLSTAFDQPSYAAAVGQMQQEIKAAQAAPKAVRKDLSNSVTGRSDEQASASKAKTATLSDIAVTAQKSGRTTAEVTKALREQGYTIGGQ